MFIGTDLTDRQIHTYSSFIITATKQTKSTLIEMENSLYDHSEDTEIAVVDQTNTDCYATEKEQNDGSQIMQIAHMIQQKAETLLTKRNHLHRVQLQLKKLRKDYDLQLDMNAKTKYNLLKQLRIAYGLEMRSIQRKHETAEKRRKIEICMKKKQILKEEKETIKSKNTLYQQFYSPHLTNINVCQRILQGNIQAIKDEQERRDNEYESLMAETGRNLNQVNALNLESGEIQGHIEIMKKTELKDDEEIASLTAQIRATLAKRASLRHAIAQATERNERAHEAMVNWEREYVHLEQR